MVFDGRPVGQQLLNYLRQTDAVASNVEVSLMDASRQIPNDPIRTHMVIIRATQAVPSGEVFVAPMDFLDIRRA